jgi:hypothetical protein
MKKVKPKHKLALNRLSATEFEEFCHDLLEELGFVNLDWRKGTGKKTSPADSGRDIISDQQHHGRRHPERSRSSGVARDLARIATIGKTKRHNCEKEQEKT